MTSPFLRRVITPTVIAVLIGVATSANAAQPSAKAEGDFSCRSYPDIAVNVMPVFDEAKLDLRYNLAGIQSLSQKTKHKIPHYESVTLGVASYHPLMQFYIPIIQHLMPDGSFCARAQHVDARIGFKDVTIYIASEFPQGSCDYQAVLIHEQKHIEVNRQLLKEYVPKIQSRLEQYLKINGMFMVPNEAYADKLLREKLSKVMDEITQEMSQENQKRQRLVDSPQEYAKNNTVCNGHIARVVKSYYRGGR